jgi:hypothetical protein
MKGQLTSAALLLLLIALSSGAHAHGGGLDASGCHNDRKNGGYHCHRAQAPAPRTSLQSTRIAPVQTPRQANGLWTADRAFANCTEARSVGAAPVRRGQPGYGAHLDRDNDGVGCE